jgi:hypothetical protein
MSPHDRDEPGEVDALVLAYLDRQAVKEDGEAGLARVRGALARTPKAAPPRGRGRSRWALMAAVAACIAVAFLGGLSLGPVQASSRELVEQTRRVHQAPMERCYVVEIRRTAQSPDGQPLLRKIPRQVRVWTCGDRFRVEMRHDQASPPFVWGREQEGALWAVLGPHRGVRITAEQAPRPLALLADVYSLNIDTLLDNVLRDCTITEEPAGAEGKGSRILRAEPQSARTRLWLRRATLEIDREAKVLRRLVLTRNRLGIPFAEAVFTLAETQPADLASYQLSSRLDPPFRIHEGTIDPAVKLEVLTRWLGARAGAKEFEDVTGKRHTPLSQPGKKATVLFFLLPECPIANAYAPEIKRICETYAPKKVAAFIVHADPDVTAAQARKHAKEYGLPCPVLLDPTHILVKRTGVSKAPEVAVLSPDGKVEYRGRIDDLYADLGKRRAQPTQRDLRNALDAILAGKPVSRATTAVIGCDLPEPNK